MNLARAASLQEFDSSDYPHPVAAAISADGKVVVGYSYTQNEPFRWTRDGGFTRLSSTSHFSWEASSVSADGSVVTGTAYDGLASQGVRWTASTGAIKFGSPDDTVNSIAKAVSGDGSMIGGSFGDFLAGSQAFTWSSSGGFIRLGFLPGGYFYSDVVGVSSDGSVLAGDSYSTRGLEAYRWTASSGMVGLGFLPGGAPVSYAMGISADGSVVVGYGYFSAGYTKAFRWSETTGMVNLGDLPEFKDLKGITFSSTAVATSADGSVVVGADLNENWSVAFRWDPVHGMQSIASLLAASGVDLTGWVLQRATGVSADGNTIIGGGEHNGQKTYWIAVLDSPSPTPTPSPSPTPSDNTDRVAPRIHVFSGLRQVTAYGFVILSGNATDNRGVKRVEIQTGNGPYVRVQGSPQFWYQLLNLSPGRNAFHVRAIDTSGNSSLVRTVIVMQGT